jgi:hypothetical protein
MAHAIERLLCKHEALSSNPSSNKKQNKTPKNPEAGCR